jgi:hypothetical protein
MELTYRRPMIRPEKELLVTQSHVSSRPHCRAVARSIVAIGQTHVEDCLRSASPGFAEAWNGKISCVASGDPRTQERNAMIETAQQLYEQHTQKGSPSLTLMARIHKEMSHMDFHVTKEAAGFATEAQWPS